MGLLLVFEVRRTVARRGDCPPEDIYGVGGVTPRQNSIIPGRASRTVEGNSSPIPCDSEIVLAPGASAQSSYSS